MTRPAYYSEIDLFAGIGGSVMQRDLLDFLTTSPSSQEGSPAKTFRSQDKAMAQAEIGHGAGGDAA